MTANTLICDICHNESGGTFVGVASVPGAPVSIAWCSECLKRESAPAFVFDHDYLFVAQGHLEALNEWARKRVTWDAGRYIGFEEYVKRFTQADVDKAIANYTQAVGQQGPIEDGPKGDPDGL